MVDSNKKRKEFISEGDMATLLQRYDTTTILKLLQEMAYYAEPKMDWNELVKKTSTGITCAREYQLLWRHLAYRDSLLPMDDNALLQDDDSDMEFELEASPAVSVDAVTEAVAHVKVIAASYVPSESDIPEDSICEAPLTINIPYGLQRRPQEPSDSYWSSRGMNITFPISLQKAAEGHSGNGLASNMGGPRKKRKKWSAEEDLELIAAVKRHGEGSWALISKEEYEGEITVAQLSQRWGSIRRRGDLSNSSTQSYQQQTEAANRALSLAVGNRVPSKKVAVGMSIPPVLTSGSTTGAQGNGSSLQGQQQAKPVVQAIPRAATAVQTAKSRVTARKPTSTLRAELMVTANSVATAACMSGLGTAASVPKVEPGKSAAPALVSKVKSSQASLPRPSGISSSVMNVEPVKTASAASLPRPSGISPTLNAEPVKSASTASFPRPLGTISSSKAEPVKTALAAALPRPSGIISAPKADLVKTGHAVSLPRPSGITSSTKAELMKTASAASSPRPESMPSAPKGEPLKSVSAATTKTQVVGPLSARNAANGPFNKPSPMAPFSKGPTIQNISVPSRFASSRLAPTQRVNATTVMPQNPSVGVAVTSSSKPVGVQKEQTQGSRTSPLVTTTLQPNKTISTNSVISAGKPVATHVDTPPSLMPKKDQVPQTCTDKSSLAKPPEKVSSSTVPPSVVAEPEPKPKDEASKGKSPDGATVTGTEQQ
uniref:Uncharacterized protein n=1 Tax=Brassica campestris TaxID=3711 RepID=A0A3P5XYH2_BRACM|nr:unnamed protein product [Brassica rapa]